MRPVHLEDPRELLELHAQEAEERRLREAVVDCLAELLWFSESERTEGIDWSEERMWLRYEIADIRREERRVQRRNGTLLVLDPPSYDREAGDEPAEVFDWDLDRLAWHGITVPATACVVEALDPREYARRAMWEGF